MISITIYSRQGCHLCEQMKATVEQVAAPFPHSLEEVDISTDPELESRFGLEIPVLLVDGRKTAKYRITEAALERVLRDRIGKSG